MRNCKFDPATGDLYYIDQTTLYKTSRSQWEAALAEVPIPFNDEYGLGLPGAIEDRSLESHYNFIGVDGYIYTVDNTAVWRVSGMTGAWDKFIGKPSENPSNPILPEYTRLCSVAYAEAQAEPLLFITAQREDSSYTCFLVRLTQLELGFTYKADVLNLGLPVSADQRVE
jgi:hypothetical protein